MTNKRSMNRAMKWKKNPTAATRATSTSSSASPPSTTAPPHSIATSPSCSFHNQLPLIVTPSPSHQLARNTSRDTSPLPHSPSRPPFHQVVFNMSSLLDANATPPFYRGDDFLPLPTSSAPTSMRESTIQHNMCLHEAINTLLTNNDQLQAKINELQLKISMAHDEEKSLRKNLQHNNAALYNKSMHSNILMNENDCLKHVIIALQANISSFKSNHIHEHQDESLHDVQDPATACNNYHTLHGCLQHNEVTCQNKLITSVLHDTPLTTTTENEPTSSTTSLHSNHTMMSDQTLTTIVNQLPSDSSTTTNTTNLTSTHNTIHCNPIKDHVDPSDFQTILQLTTKDAKIIKIDSDNWHNFVDVIATFDLYWIDTWLMHEKPSDLTSTKIIYENTNFYVTIGTRITSPIAI